MQFSKKELRKTHKLTKRQAKNLQRPDSAKYPAQAEYDQAVKAEVDRVRMMFPRKEPNCQFA